MKQTAVEWLIEEMIKRKFFAKNTPLSYTTLEHLANEAKQMEKEQIVEAFEHVNYNLDDGVHYYEQTYKSE